MKISEENFVVELKHKNEKALEYVLVQYGWIIKSIVKKNMYNLERYHEECINDILLGIWNNISQFDEERSSFSNWVAGISKYKSFDYMRKYLRDLEHKNIDDLEEVASSQDEISQIDEEEDFEHILACLNNKDKDLFRRLYIEEQGMDEITKQTGMKAEVIYNRVSRGKRKIRELFNFVGR